MDWRRQLEYRQQASINLMLDKIDIPKEREITS